MIKTAEFKRNEGLAKKVMDILITDYDTKVSAFETSINYNLLDIIKWSIEDYESCGFNMKSYRTYYNILKKQNERRTNRLESLN